jgi:hypothetical protein
VPACRRPAGRTYGQWLVANEQAGQYGCNVICRLLQLVEACFSEWWSLSMQAVCMQAARS